MVEDAGPRTNEKQSTRSSNPWIWQTGKVSEMRRRKLSLTKDLHTPVTSQSTQGNRCPLRTMPSILQGTGDTMAGKCPACLQPVCESWREEPCSRSTGQRPSRQRTEERFLICHGHVSDHTRGWPGLPKQEQEEDWTLRDHCAEPGKLEGRAMGFSVSR